MHINADRCVNEDVGVHTTSGVVWTPTIILCIVRFAIDCNGYFQSVITAQAKHFAALKLPCRLHVGSILYSP